VDHTATLDAPHDPAAVFSWVDDLSRYAEWLEIVPRAEPDEAHPDDTGPAWRVDLRARLGPLARSKRLRMVRTTHEPDRWVRFERVEHDGRRHSPWVLDARVEALEAGTRLTMHLHYGGSLFGPVLERLLGDEIERSRQRLLGCLDR
jgi:hypothetical protein